MNAVFKICIVSLVPLMLMTACGKPKQMTAEQQWQQFCRTYQDAAGNIMYDRQNDVPAAQSIEHLKKIPEGQQREMLIAVVQQAHQIAKVDNQPAKMQALEDFKKGKFESCMATPHVATATP